MPAQTVIKVRRDTAANWISADPTLASGEIGFETDTNQLKIGNGSSAWTALDYTSGGASVEISETAPASPDEGNVWFNSTDGRAYIYYDSTWVDLNPGIAGPTGATGETGIAIQTSEPSSTDVLWLDTDEEPDVPVPAGGTDGQVLTKTSSADYATAWEDIPEGTTVVYSATAPVDTGAIWYSTENGNAYVYYDGFWASISGVPTLPVGGTTGQVLAKASNTDYATQWVAPSGLVLLNTTTFSGLSSQSVNDVFTSTYDSYKVVYNFTAANTATGLRFQLRVGGADATGANYARQFVVIAGTGTSVNAGRAGSQTAYDMIDIQNKATGEMMIYNPNKAEATTFATFGGNDLASNSNLTFMTTTGNHQLSNAYTGFTVTAGSGTITGQLSVYGLAK